MFVKDSVQSITEYLEKALTSKTVIGEAQQFGDVTLIPVVDVTFGFGAGGGEAGTKENTGNGGGGGAGAKVGAKAIIVIKDGEVKVIPLAKPGTVDKLIEAVPVLLEKVSFGKKADTKQEKAEEKAEEKTEADK
jgi:uncharacterized spore protein YtfJ